MYKFKTEKGFNGSFKENGWLAELVKEVIEGNEDKIIEESDDKEEPTDE